MLREEPTEPITHRPTLSPGVARPAQAVSGPPGVRETLITLADQLLVLFDEIPGAGFVHQERRAMQQHVQQYFRLADGAWETLATGQLDDLAGNPTFNVAVDALEQRLLQIHASCEQAKHNPKARGGWLWRRRVRLYSRALLDWKRCLDSGSNGSLPDPTTCGRVLFRAHGRVGLASISGLDHLLVFSLPILGFVASLFLAGIFGLVDIQQNAPARYLVPIVLAGLSALYILWFSTAGPSPLPLVLGYALTRREAMYFARPLRATRVINPRLGMLRGTLRLLLTTLGTLLLIGLVGLLAFTALFARRLFFELHSTGSGTSIDAYMKDALQPTLGRILPLDNSLLILIMLPLFCLLAIALIFLPFTLLVQARMSRELLAHPTRSPEIRRYALRPALELLSFHTITLFLVVIPANSLVTLGATPLLPSTLPFITARSLAYIGALVLPYLLLVDLPYREGIARWRAARLRELRRNRSEIRRDLSQTLPQVDIQAELLAIQEQVNWLYTRAQEDEVKAVPAAPFSIEGRLAVLALTILTGFLLDQLNGFLGELLKIHL